MIKANKKRNAVLHGNRKDHGKNLIALAHKRQRLKITADSLQNTKHNTPEK